MIRHSQRLEQVGAYLFSVIGQRIREMKAKGADVLSLGIGDPDLPTPDHIVQELIRAVSDSSDKDRHRYGSDWPSPVFSEAVANYYRQRFGVELDPKDEVLILIGSKDGIGHVAFAYLDPGDVALIPEPGYPVYRIGTIFAGAEPFVMPLKAENGWVPNFEDIPADVLKRAKLLWLNYPNNPTTAVADHEFFRWAVEFARQHNLLICHDAAYIDITFDGYKAPSILEADGAKDVAVEFFSLSKPYNMTGWRIAAAVGNKDAVKALGTIKDNLDSGVFRPIQFAGAKALTGPQDCVQELLAVYQRRRDFVISALNKMGWELDAPKGTFYIWAPVPHLFEGSVEFATFLLEKAHVAVTPGGGYGPCGEGYFRISLTYPEEHIQKAMQRIGEAMASLR